MGPFSSVAFELASAARPMQGPAAAPTTTVEQSGFNTVKAALQNLNGRAEGLGSKTLQMGSRDGALKPGDMLMMAMKAHEFLFHCELTSNVADRTSDGVQHLFRG